MAHNSKGSIKSTTEVVAVLQYIKNSSISNNYLRQLVKTLKLKKHKVPQDLNTTERLVKQYRLSIDIIRDNEPATRGKNEGKEKDKKDVKTAHFEREDTPEMDYFYKYADNVVSSCKNL